MSQCLVTGSDESQTEQLPLVSVITVVLNGQATLGRTLASVAAQTYPRIEYVVVDGGSTDGTLEIIEKFRANVHHFVTGPDKGIYDAMNKGIRASTGEYLWFINSGDEIFSPRTLTQVLKDRPKADIYYGQSLVVDIAGRAIGLRRLSPPPGLTWRDFRRGMVVSHQSVIVKRDICSFYNTRYRFSADYDWVLKALRGSTKVVDTGMVLSKFLEGGVTRKNILKGLYERFQIMSREFGLIAAILYHLPITARFLWFVLKNRRF